MEANYVHKDSTTLVQDETGTYIEIPKNKIKFNSKEAEIIFDLTLENDELRLKNQELKEKIKKLSQWDTDKDTRNSRQRVANAKLLKENQELKKQLENKYEKVGTLTNELLYEENTKLINQQKEFIKYLEDDLKEKYRDMGYRHNIFREILQKYKSIIGVSDENN